MVKKLHRLPATSTPTRISASGEMPSRSVWSPVSDHVIQQTGRTLADVGQLTDVSSFPVNNRQHSTLWSPYLGVKIGELLFFHYSAYC